jgi:predicted transcriptional regulator
LPDEARGARYIPGVLIQGEHMAESIKERVLEAVRQLPPDATVEDAMERLYFLAKIERGVADAEAGRVVAHDEVKRRFSLP